MFYHALSLMKRDSILLVEMLFRVLEWHYPNFFSFERELLLALRANAIVALYYLVWGLKFKTMI